MSGISTVELFHRVGRRGRTSDFTKLSMSELQDILQAINAANMAVYNALPEYFREQTQGFVLPAPLTVTGVGVTQYGKTVTGITFTSAQFGQSIVIDGDPAWNQIIGTNALLNPYMGATGTVNAVIYGDAIHSTTVPLDRIIGNPRFADQSLTPLFGWSMQRGVDGSAGIWPFFQTQGTPQCWFTQVYGNSQGNSPIMTLRFSPAPDRAYAVNCRIGFWPLRLTMADYDAATVLPVPDQFIEKSLIPIALREFMSTPTWVTKGDEDRIWQSAADGEAFLRAQPAQIGAPSNRVFTPIGF